MVDHEINEPYKPYSCQVIVMLVHIQDMSYVYYSNYLGLKVLVYGLYSCMLFHIKLLIIIK